MCITCKDIEYSDLHSSTLAGCDMPLSKDGNRIFGNVKVYRLAKTPLGETKADKNESFDHLVNTG